MVAAKVIAHISKVIAWSLDRILRNALRLKSSTDWL
jgi:hypothetical protein